jgi:hypothetical protein
MIQGSGVRGEGQRGRSVHEATAGTTFVSCCLARTSRRVLWSSEWSIGLFFTFVSMLKYVNTQSDVICLKPLLIPIFKVIRMLNFTKCLFKNI